MKKALSMILLVSLLLTACGKGPQPQQTSEPGETEQTSQSTAESSEAPTETEPAPVWDGAYIGQEEYLQLAGEALEAWKQEVTGALSGQSLEHALEEFEKAKNILRNAATFAEARAAVKLTEKILAEQLPLSSGAVILTGDAKTQALAAMESAMIRSGIAGLTLGEKADYYLLRDRVEPAGRTLREDYGFGILQEGRLNAPLEAEAGSAQSMYFHDSVSSDPGTLNYLKAKPTEDDALKRLFAVCSASYYAPFAADNSRGWEYRPELAADFPQSVSLTADGKSDSWDIPLRTEGLAYCSGSALESRSAFNGRPVCAEDYEYTFKLLLTKHHAYYRGAELAAGGTLAIRGAAEYYEGSTDGYSEALWENVGISVREEGGQAWLTLVFTKPCSCDEVTAFLSDRIFAPIPEAFVQTVGKYYYMGFNAEEGTDPADNSLSVGPYFLQEYAAGEKLVFGKNPFYALAAEKYAPEGVVYAVLPDRTAELALYKEGLLDICRLDEADVREFAESTELTALPTGEMFTLQMNTAAGEAALTNAWFRRALSLALDRRDFAVRRALLPAFSFLPLETRTEAGELYRETEAGRLAMESLTSGTDGSGCNEEQAAAYFRLALSELEADALYAPGTEQDPTVIRLDILWQDPAQGADHHGELAYAWERIFNDPAVSGGKYRLEVHFEAAENWQQVYDRIAAGSYDLALGTASGAAKDPWAYCGHYSGDNRISGGVTLQARPETADADKMPVIFDGARWSLDALCMAAAGGVYTEGGAARPLLQISLRQLHLEEDGSYTGAFVLEPADPERIQLKVEAAYIWNRERYERGDGLYQEESLQAEIRGGEKGETVVGFRLTPELLDRFRLAKNGEGTRLFGLDLQYACGLKGESLRREWCFSGIMLP